MTPPATPTDRVFRFIIGGAVVVAVVLLLWVGIVVFKGRYDKAVIDVYVKTENERLHNVSAIANETMAVEEAADTATIAAKDKEIRDARKPTTNRPDGLSDRQRRGCIIMRQQGQDLGAVPACRGVAR